MEILDAAFEEFVKTGYAATNLQSVAERAGVTKGTIYFHFESKERVFHEMMRHKSRRLAPELGKLALVAEGSHADRFRTSLAFVFQKIAGNREDREILRLLIAEGSRFPEMTEQYYLEFMQPVIAHFRELIDAGIAAGEFRPGLAHSFTEIFLSPALLLMAWTFLFGTSRPLEREAFADASIDLLLNGMFRLT